MGPQLAADLILILHLLFIFFVIFGGFLLLHRTGWVWLHMPTALWGVWIEWSGKTCPLTPMENHFRQLAYGQSYHEGFIEHYIVPLIYPEQLTVQWQWLFGALVLIINLFIYLYAFKKQRERQKPVDE